MVDPVSNANASREIGPANGRAQGAPAPHVPEPVEVHAPPAHLPKHLAAAVERLIARAAPANSKLQIMRDESTGTFIYRSVSPTGEILRQWPSEALLRLKETVRHLEGVLLDHKA